VSELLSSLFAKIFFKILKKQIKPQKRYGTQKQSRFISLLHYPPMNARFRDLACKKIIFFKQAIIEKRENRFEQ
jgi:hypothetical protein